MKTTWILALAAGALAIVGLPSTGRADSMADCVGEDLEQRIIGCTDLIDRNDPATDFSVVYSMRGLAFSIKGSYGQAIADFDVAIRMRPDLAGNYNNRAWAYYRWGKAREGLPDIEKAIELDPGSAFAYDTRAHIRQVLGDAAAAMRDYDRVLFYGGPTLTKVYQCGLGDLGIYNGERDGLPRPELLQALEKCAAKRDCDPLPPDEKCH